MACRKLKIEKIRSNAICVCTTLDTVGFSLKKRSGEFFFNVTITFGPPTTSQIL